jgi:hypothetical protein
VVGIAGTALIAPLATPGTALADEAFYERIHQQFAPVDVEPLDIHLETAPAEELPPEPEPEPAAEASASFAPLFYTGGGSPAEWMAAAGIPESEWGYVDFIVSRESGWNPNATNSSSGACGLAQALPCSKIGGAGGYDPVTALAWQYSYVTNRYGGYAEAYAFWQDNHWY